MERGATGAKTEQVWSERKAMYTSILLDLLDHHDWAQGKLLSHCERLSAEALDLNLPMGPGSLRATLAHMWGAEVIWLSRWRANPMGFPAGENLSISDLRNGFSQVAQERRELIAAESANDLQRVVSYRNLKGEPFENRLCDLVMHVANHATHHRAQVLQFMRVAGITIPGGLDYIFYRMSAPTVLLPASTAETCRKYGLEVGSVARDPIPMEAEPIQRYGMYGDWCMQRLFEVASSLSDAELNREFPMGMGTLRKTLIHIHDAEKWWPGNWAGRQDPFPQTDAGTSLTDLRSSWEQIAEQRRVFVGRSSPADLAKIVSANFGAGVAQFRIGESLLQLACHGTHHRAQAINMLRRVWETSGTSAAGNVPALDLVVWLREPRP